MGCTPEEAEDVVQTTLVKAYQAWERFDGRHLRSWLIRILRNERLMLLRGAHPTESLDDPNAQEAADAPFWDEVSWRMAADRIKEEMERLPEVYRMTVHLCDVEELTYEEAAEVMEVPIGTVRSRLFRARAMLRKRLEPMGGQLEGAWL
jgi:RNA polymerase sigma-70 factor (ECF subfamily)